MKVQPLHEPAARGRPLDRQLDGRILKAAIAEMSARGIAQASLDAIAARAGVSKATIYKRWPSKDRLCVDAVSSLHTEIGPPDTGDPRRDLETLMAVAVRLGRQPSSNRVLPRLVGEMVDRDELAAAFRAAVLEPRRRACEILLGRAVECGALRADFDRDLAIDLLIGPIMFRRLISGAPLPDSLSHDLVEVVWKAYAP
jgi:AcrR family transcriptional regulator